MFLSPLLLPLVPWLALPMHRSVKAMRNLDMDQRTSHASDLLHLLGGEIGEVLRILIGHHYVVVLLFE
jgi:hypothetical protein